MAWSELSRPAKTVVAAVTAFFTTLGAAAVAWPIIEPVLLAHRAYVRDVASEESAKIRRDFAPTQVGMLDVQISIARSRRAQVNDRLITLEIEVPKSENSSELIKRRQQIDKLKEELVDLDAEIRQLRLVREKS